MKVEFGFRQIGVKNTQNILIAYILSRDMSPIEHIFIQELRLILDTHFTLLMTLRNESQIQR